tara:strand:+ start:264 stop:611 length:348 start_codon:yes stop_codon:yes gene_type:complete
MIGSFFKFITPTCCKSTRAVDTFQSIETTASDTINSNEPFTECVPFEFVPDKYVFSNNVRVPLTTEVTLLTPSNCSNFLNIVTANHIPFIKEKDVDLTNITPTMQLSFANHTRIF